MDQLKPHIQKYSACHPHTVPLKSKLTPSRETRLVSRECTGSTNASYSGDTKCRYSNWFFMFFVYRIEGWFAQSERLARETWFLFWSTMRVPVYHKISSKIFNTVLFTSAKFLQLLLKSDFSLTFSFCKLQNTSWKYLNWWRARVYKYVLRQRCARVYKYVLQLCGFYVNKKWFVCDLNDS